MTRTGSPSESDASRVAAASPVDDRLGGVLLVVAIAVVCILGLRGLSDPWGDGLHAINGGAYYGSVVKYGVRLGPEVTKFGNVLMAFPTNPPEYQWYFNHPQLYGAVQTSIGLLFGVSESAIRGVAIAFALFGVVFVHLTLRRIAGPTAGGAGALALAGSQAFGFWGLMPSHESAAVAMTACVYWLYLRYEADPTGRRYRLLAFAYLLAGLTDWLGLFSGAALFVLAAFSNDRARLTPRIAALALVGVLVFCIHVLHFGLVIGDVVQAMKNMTAVASLDSVPKAPDFLARSAAFAAELWSPAGLWVALLGTVACLFRSGVGRKLAVFAAAACLPGVVNVLLFPGHAALHDFWLIPSAPGVAAGSAALVVAAHSLKAPGIRAVALALALVVVGAIAATGVAGSVARAAGYKSTLYVDAGTMLNRELPEDAVVMTNAGWHQIFFYLDRPGAPRLDSGGKFREFSAWLEKGGISRSRFIYFLDGAASEDLRSALDEFGDAVPLGSLICFRAR